MDTGLRESNLGTPCGQVCCFKALPNPEGRGLYLSYKVYGRSCISREYAAAWLIAHWYEHLLEICECLGAARSGFRQALISDLLYLQAPEPVV